MGRYITRGDAALIAALTVISLAGFGSARLAGFSGNHAVVEVEGRRVLELPLDRDVASSVDGPLGETVIEVRDRAVSITRSPCPRGYCMHMGRIRYPGEILVCVPNRVCVRIRGNGERKRFLVPAKRQRSFDGVTE
jgi:hypothetical protein